MHSKLSSSLPGLALWLLLLIVYGLYLPGQFGVMHFDDEVNLHGLSQVQDGWTALMFTASGESGPLSRPIALASFLLNWGDWPVYPRGFLYINILLHLLNGALLAWFTLRLVQLVNPALTRRAEWIALGAAALWLVMPLLASTSLLIIQRMASLSATFVLAGLLTYVMGLSREVAGQVTGGRILQATGIGLGTLLAVFTKENGILLPLYALILEVTVLTGVSGLSAWRRWRLLLLALPSLAIFAMLAWKTSPAAFAFREFTLSERLLTQPIILWDYVRLALMPSGASAFSPFYDDYPIARSLLNPPTALLAILAWLVLLGLALWQRQRWPLLALTVLWFLGGHVLESTVLPLELYFEHRNYLPLIGPAIALSWLAWTIPGESQRVAPVLLGLYILVQAAALWQTTALWGQPLLAGKLWAERHPNSSRAQQFFAQRHALRGDQPAAYQVLAQAANNNPGRVDLALQAMQLACANGWETEVAENYHRAFIYATEGVFSNASLDAFSTVLDLRRDQRCDSLSDQQMHSLLENLLANPRYQASRAQNYLHHLKSRLYRTEKDFSGTMHHLEAAFESQPDIGTAVMIVSTLLSGGLREEAVAFIAEAREEAPLNPVLRGQWLSLLEQLENQIIRQNPPS